MSSTAHRRARTRGVSRPLYWPVRAILTPLLRSWFRIQITGADAIPREGAVILAPNHKSFLDPFFLTLATRRPLRFMAKVEMFRGPLVWLLPRLGAFPVRRTQHDGEAMATARHVLDAGEVLVVFLEGTRVDEPDVLGSPHHGAGRLAVETGAPIIPVAISGTAHLWLGPVPKPRHVRIALLDAVEAPADAPAAVQLIDERIWPAVQQEYGRLNAIPGLVLSALAAIGVGAGLAARRTRPAPPRIVGVVAPRRRRRHERRKALAQRARRALRALRR